LTVRIGLAAATVEEERNGSGIVVWLLAMPAACSDPEGKKSEARRVKLEEILDLGVFEC
jgi:hypothetical protein